MQNPDSIIYRLVHIKGGEVFTFGHRVQNPGEIPKTDVNLGPFPQKGHDGNKKSGKGFLRVFLVSNLGFFFQVWQGDETLTQSWRRCSLLGNHGTRHIVRIVFLCLFQIL